VTIQEALQFAAAVGSLATALALVIGIWQITLTRKQALTDFEDDLDREYRNIIADLPVKAMLGSDLSEDEFAVSLPAPYRYVDFSNKQVFLRQMRRVSKRTWAFWRDGIQSNLSRSPFRRAWEQIKAEAQPSFSELRRLEDSGFKSDPGRWHK